MADDNGIRRTEEYNKSTKCPVVINQLFDGFNTIDVHDHYRQNTLGLERHWRTHKRWHRVFATLLGVIVTDAYFMYRLEYQKLCGSDLNILSYEDWVSELASDLIYNTEDKIATRRSSNSSYDSDSSSSNSELIHVKVRPN